MNKPSKKRTALLAGMLFSAAVFIYGSYSLWYEYLRWTNLVLVGLNFALALAAFAASGAMCSETVSEKRRNAKGRITAVIVSGVIYSALFWGITYIHNMDGKTNTLAIHAGTVLCSIAFGIMYVMFFASSAKKKLKALYVPLCVLSVVAAAAVPGYIARDYYPTQLLYPVYRAFVPQGGAEIKDTGVSYTFARSTQKAQPTMNIDSIQDIEIHLAKNEREGFQIFAVTGKKDRSISVSVSDFKGKKGTLPAEVYKEIYNETGEVSTFFSNRFADALVPVTEGEEIALEKDRVLAFYIETRADKKAPAGEYTAEVAITVNPGPQAEEIRVPVKATVWDFALPDTPSCETAIGLGGSAFYELNNASSDDDKNAVYREYYDYLLDHRISVYTLPYDILDSRADKYMSDPRVTSFLIPYPDDDELLIQYYEKVTSNPVWAEKGYFYPIDEPCDADAIARYDEITGRLSRLCPGYNMVTPFCTWQVEIDGENKSMIELQKDKSSILCGVTNNVAEGENTLAEMYDARAKLGSKLWFYVCCGPQGEYCNNFIYQDAIKHRELFWQEKMIDFDGFLYWHSTYYEKGNPWETGKTWDNYDASGDGCFVYPGPYAGLEGPVGTIRLKNISDGLEDYDYLTLAEAEFGREWTDAKISRITGSFTSYNTDYEMLEAVRCEIGEALASE